MKTLSYPLSSTPQKVIAGTEMGVISGSGLFEYAYGTTVADVLFWHTAAYHTVKVGPVVWVRGRGSVVVSTWESGTADTEDLSAAVASAKSYADNAEAYATQAASAAATASSATTGLTSKAAAGANADITSMSQLTRISSALNLASLTLDTPLPIASGGLGASDIVNARTNLLMGPGISWSNAYRLNNTAQSQYVKVLTLSGLPQVGYNVGISVYSGTGYNGYTNQNAYDELLLRTGNSGTVGSASRGALTLWKFRTSDTGVLSAYAVEIASGVYEIWFRMGAYTAGMSLQLRTPNVVTIDATMVTSTTAPTGGVNSETVQVWNSVSAAVTFAGTVGITGALTGTSGTFTGTLSAATVTQTSDARLKFELEEIADPLAKLAMLTGYTYFKSTGYGEIEDAGILAQDLLKVLPQGVVQTQATIETRNGLVTDPLAVKDGALIALLVQAVNALARKVG